MNQENLNKIIRLQVIWAEIKAQEQQYKILNAQMREIEVQKSEISFQTQKKLREIETIQKQLMDWEMEHIHDVKL